MHLRMLDLLTVSARTEAPGLLKAEQPRVVWWKFHNAELLWGPIHVTPTHF